VFVDETGFSFRAKVATTWAPIGQTPILRRISKRRELSTVIGLTLFGKIDKRHFEGSAIHVMLHSQNHAQPSLLFNRLWNGIGVPALHG
jgi:hypothetical protein